MDKGTELTGVMGHINKEPEVYLNKDLTNLMAHLKRQDEDSKPILYLGKCFKKVILPYEEYQKMKIRLDALENSKPGKALECLEYLADFNLETDILVGQTKAYGIIKQALQSKSLADRCWEIVKAKKVDLNSLERSFSYVDYNNRLNRFGRLIAFELTEAEFNTLKEGLK